MSYPLGSLLIILALALNFCARSNARVVWVPEEFDPHAGPNILRARDTSSSCGGVDGLQQCGGAFPSDFCCSTNTFCMRLNGTSATAAICCPAGQTCGTIGPVSCDQSFQNPALSPGSEFHSSPTQQLKSCGSGQCCPMGYSCDGGQCNALPPTSATTSATSATSSAASSSSTSVASSSESPSPSSTTTPVPNTNNEHSPSNSTAAAAGSGFNGKSFAAGFVPGVALGALVVGLVLLLLYRKKHGRSSVSYVEGETPNRDTLTDLGTLPFRRPTTHARSISEPTVDPTSSYRTDFLRSTPPRGMHQPFPAPNTYSVDIQSPASGAAPTTTAQSRTPRVKALFSRSPFMNQDPSTPEPSQIPNNLKRGTPSVKVSPVRGLKKQKSLHSLRRQVTNASSRITNPSRSNSNRRTELSRTGSTETIQVLMPTTEPYTPDRRMLHHLNTHSPDLDEPSYDLPESATTWESEDESSVDDEIRTGGDGRHRSLEAIGASILPIGMQGGSSASSASTTRQQPEMQEASVSKPSAIAGPPTKLVLGSPYTTPNNITEKNRSNYGAPAGREAESTTLAPPLPPPPVMGPLTRKNGADAGPSAVSGASAGNKLQIPGDDRRRDTTFSALMERAGLNRDDLLSGGKVSREGKRRK